MRKMIADFIKEASPGVSYRSVPLIKTGTGTNVELPIILLQGNNDGPIFYVGTLIHGDEFNGIGVIFELLDSIKPRDLRGRIVFVTVQNPLALLHRQHFIPGDLYDTYKVDAHVCLPGSATGQLSDRLANAIFETIMCADYAVDLHASMIGGKYVDHAFSPSTRGGETANKARKLAEIFATPIVVEMESGLYVAENMLHSITTKEGVPTFGAELGGGGCIEPDSVEIGHRGIRNVLKHLEMIKGEIEENPDQVIVDRVLPIRTSVAGFVKHNVHLGARVAEGDVIAKVHDLHLRVIEAVKSPVNGIVYRHKTYPYVNVDERVAMIAVPKEAS